ncbi:MAG: hypothetical protein LQ351_002692 [Letrouitia transgressa]|nr:MAG: hypothetical protein LQ351_002692 [Letrouitia transgressa]
MSQSSPFGVILPSRPVITNPVTVSQTQYAFTIPAIPTFSHVVVFLVPGINLPPSTVAAVYIQFPHTEFKLLGAIGNDKQTAIFRVRDGEDNGRSSSGLESEEEMADVDGGASVPNLSQEQVTVGISVEPASDVEMQLAWNAAAAAEKKSSALVLANRSQVASPLSTKVLAQRIIKNAFNFLASFAGETKVGGEEMVPLKSFRGWWEKFERRVENDPGFLERQDDV